jgi:hypothetical protein
MTLRTQLAYAAAGLVLILGLVSFLNPPLAMNLLGFQIPRGLAGEVGPTRAISEVRSTYGALHLTMAVLMLWAVPLRPRTAPLLRTIGILWLGAAAGRVASLLIDGVFGPVNLVLLAVQLFIGGTLVWASVESASERIEARIRRDDARRRRETATRRPVEADRTEPRPPSERPGPPPETPGPPPDRS